MIFLVVGMLAGQSRARKSDFDICYDNCYINCLALTTVNFSLEETCSGCYDHCELTINRKACFLFWCWQVK